MKGHKFRYSLAIMFIVTAACACGFGLWLGAFASIGSVKAWPPGMWASTTIRGSRRRSGAYMMERRTWARPFVLRAQALHRLESALGGTR